MSTVPEDSQAQEHHQDAKPAIPLMGEPTLQSQLPNILTTARVVLTVVFAALLTLLPDPSESAHRVILYVALAIFLIAAISDALDGYLARKWNAISVFGRVMDPFADKALILTAFIILPAIPGSHIAPWMTALIVARELLITSIRGVCESHGIDFSASLIGKLKMIGQSIVVPVILLTLAIDPGARSETTQLINAGLGYAVTLITIYSAVPYITRAVSALKAR